MIPTPRAWPGPISPSPLLAASFLCVYVLQLYPERGGFAFSVLIKMMNKTNGEGPRNSFRRQADDDLVHSPPKGDEDAEVPSYPWARLMWVQCVLFVVCVLAAFLARQNHRARTVRRRDMGAQKRWIPEIDFDLDHDPVAHFKPSLVNFELARFMRPTMCEQDAHIRPRNDDI